MQSVNFLEDVKIDHFRIAAWHCKEEMDITSTFWTIIDTINAGELPPFVFRGCGFYIEEHVFDERYDADCMYCDFFEDVIDLALHRCEGERYNLVSKASVVLAARREANDIADELAHLSCAQ